MDLLKFPSPPVSLLKYTVSSPYYKGLNHKRKPTALLLSVFTTELRDPFDVELLIPTG